MALFVLGIRGWCVGCGGGAGAGGGVFFCSGFSHLSFTIQKKNPLPVLPGNLDLF